MISTGNLYLQVYDESSNKYVELSPKELSIRTLVNSGSFPFTGFLITGDLRLGKKLEMVGSIDIGRFNRTSEGHNIGVVNKMFAPSGGLNSPSFNIGSFNYQASGFSSFNIGQSNSILSSDNSFAIGSDNAISTFDSTLFNSNQYTFGNDNNLLLSGDNNYVIGQSNNLNFHIDSSKIIGDNNTISTGETIKIIGDENQLENSSLVDSFGDSNEFIKTESIFSLGDANEILYSTGIYNISQYSYIEDSKNIIIFGNDNSIQKSDSSMILGQGNTISGSLETILIGINNDMVSTGDVKSAIVGYDNNFSDQASNLGVFGDYNSNSGNFSDSFIVGSNNYGVNSFDNNLNGSLNLIRESNVINIFGLGNQVKSSQSSSIFGQYNTLSSGIECTIIGDSNSVSGLQNYVFGNTNVVRSGDYNSIFIGINYTPTGDSKVATISLGVVDSKIEISPSEIRLDSINRPKINSENIIIQSEFDTISNAIVNTGTVFSTNTFQDPGYDKLAETILVSSFNYDSGVDVGLSFGPQEFKGTDALFLNNFNIYSTISYTGHDQTFNIIYGNHNTLNPLFTPRWLVVDNTTSGVYYRNDIVEFNVTPQIGWISTGYQVGSDLYTGTSNNFSTSLVMGSRSGLMAVDTLSFGRAYIPILY